MKRTLFSIVAVSVLLLTGVVSAFFDEVSSLRGELVAWNQTNQQADFTDVVARLYDITAPVFQDVSQTDWYNPYVGSLAEWGIVSGYKDADGHSTGKFGPGDNVTIAQTLKMAFKAAKVDEETCPLPSAAALQTHWAAHFIGCGQERGVRVLSAVQGDVNRPATRAEVLSMVHDAFGDKVPAIFSNYDDTSGVLYEKDIAYATLVGMVSGDTNAQGVPIGHFRPTASINRAEVAKMVYERLKLQARADVVGH